MKKKIKKFYLKFKQVSDLLNSSQSRLETESFETSFTWLLLPASLAYVETHSFNSLQIDCSIQRFTFNNPEK